MKTYTGTVSIDAGSYEDLAELIQEIKELLAKKCITIDFAEPDEFFENEFFENEL